MQASGAMRLYMTMTEDETTTQDHPSRPISRPRRLTPDRRTAAAIGCLLLGVFWLTMGGHSYSIDDESYLAATRALFNHTTVLTPGSDLDGVVVAMPNKNGDLTSFAPIGTLLLFAPGFVAGKVIAAPFDPAVQEEIVRLVYLSANGLFTALTAVVLFFLCRRLGARRRSAAVLALAFGLGTWAWPHAQTGFSEPGTALLLTATVLALTTWWQKQTPLAAAVTGFLAGCTVLTRPSTMLFIPILMLSGAAAAGLSRRTLSQAAWFCLGGVAPGIVFAANAWWRFGSPFDLGYPPMRYTTPLYEGIFGLVMSPGKGIIFYAPICAVAIFAARQAFIAHRRYTVTVGIMLAAHLAVYGRFDIWSGENAYGPRYLVPVLALAIALLAPVIDSGRQWMRGAVIAGAIGFIGPGLLGSSMYFNAVYNHQYFAVLANGGLTEATQAQQFLLWNFQPRSSPLMLHVRSMSDMLQNTVDRMQGEPGGITPPPVAYEERIHWHARSVELDTWWAWWPAKGGPSAIYALLVVPLGLLATSAWLAAGRPRSTVTAELPGSPVESGAA